MSVVAPFWEGVKHLFKKTFTVKHPYQRHELPDGYRGRHVLYLDRCTGCGICAWICPEKCITMVNLADQRTYPQNPEKRFPQYWYIRCCFCHFCTDYCPTAALDYTKDYDLAEYEKELIIWSPERLSKIPERYVEYRTKFHGWAGVDHVPKIEGVVKRDMSEIQDEMVRRMARRKKSRKRSRGPYRKSSSAGLRAVAS